MARKEGTHMTTYYLAVDIGASSGRHMLSHMEDGKMVLEEIYRFENGMDIIGGHRYWNTDRLFAEIKNGLKKAKELGKVPVSMGIDTWAVDYVLLDKNDVPCGRTYGYRDSRTTGMDEEVYKIIPETELYARTGIQKQIFNTIYQLMAVKTQEPEVLAAAETMLMLPDYFHFLLTGVKKQEYTNATSTQLVNPHTNDWDYELIEKLGYPTKMFLPVTKPGTVVGEFTDEIAAEIGYKCKVVLPATHDTGSAIMALPTQSDDTLYISSGTWSLMGVENKRLPLPLPQEYHGPLDDSAGETRTERRVFICRALRHGGGRERLPDTRRRERCLFPRSGQYAGSSPRVRKKDESAGPGDNRSDGSGNLSVTCPVLR